MKHLALVLSLLTAATEASPREQIDWHWDRDTQMCALQQTSASGDIIGISRVPTDDQTSVEIIAQSHSQVRKGQFEKGAIRLDLGVELPADGYAYVDNWKRQHLVAVTQDPSFLQKFIDASTLEISHEKIGKSQVALRSASAAVGALQNCEDEKMRKWGIDRGVWRTLKSHPVPLKPLSARFSSFDYPGIAAAFRVTGEVVARMDIGSDGRVKGCKSLNPSQYGGFEFATCNVLRGARFHPALDSAGNAVPAPYVAYVVFRMR